MSGQDKLQQSYPWTTTPLICCAPMRLIALAPLATAVSRAGGLGFIGAGSDCSTLEQDLAEAASLLRRSPPSTSSISTASNEQGPLPIGVGFINWGANLDLVVSAIRKYIPAAVWFFAPRNLSDLVPWTDTVREITRGRTKIWIQIGTVADAIEISKSCRPDVLVVQGTDAGGHGLDKGAGIISLLPEVADALKSHGFEGISLVAAGGIVEGRGVAASLALGASGIVMGTRFLASTEANLSKGYQNEIIRASDGGVSTVRSKVYDTLRGTTEWPEHYNGRGIINESFLDAQNGVSEEENKRLYSEAMKRGDEGWGLKGRMTTYAGTAVGLVRDVKLAGEIVEEVRRETAQVTSMLKSHL
ncbi:MAG: hypothetical protein M1827_000838 [Pycnora praestabilis]|nr:MAG: hypothetical protein M1827_000838 [Pycnora praestabilis]